VCVCVIELVQSNDAANLKTTQGEFRQLCVCECGTGTK
jgi:hypothetical protein